MPADHYIMDTDMKKVADAIRTKGQTTAPLTFPDGMVQAVNDIQTGGGHEDEDGIITGLLKGEYVNDRVIAIRDYAFYDCRKITSIDLPKADYIKNYSFAYDSGIISANLPKVTTIGGHAFYYTSGLTEISLPSIQTIKDSAFYGSGLIKADLKYVYSIGNRAFYSCKNLEKVILRDSSRVVPGGDHMFFGAKKLVIYVPNDLVQQYRSATNWAEYTIVSINALPPGERQ